MSLSDKIQITISLPDRIVWSPHVPTSSIDKNGTILDDRVAANGGVIYIPINVWSNRPTKLLYKKGFLFPVPMLIGISPTSILGNDNIIYLNRIQKLYNALVKACNSIKQRYSYRKKIWMGNIISSIRYELIDIISGRHGIIRRTMLSLPLEYSGRSVLVPEVDMEPNSVKIPQKVALSWVSNEEFRFQYGIPQNISNKEAIKFLLGTRILVGRQPTLRASNIMGMMIGGFTEFVTSLHPSIVGMMDGDFDGDQVWFAAVGDIPESIHIENLIEEYYLAQKEYKMYEDCNIKSYKELEKVIHNTMSLSINGQSIDPTASTSYPGYNPSYMLNGIDINEFLSKDGSKSYQVMKRDVAMAGGLGGFIVSLALSTGNRKDVENAMKFRRDISQITLDCKHGITNYEGDKIINAIQQFIYRKNTRIGIKEILNKVSSKEVVDSIYKLLMRFEGLRLREVIQSHIPHISAAKRGQRISIEHIPYVINKVEGTLP